MLFRSVTKWLDLLILKIEKEEKRIKKYLDQIIKIKNAILNMSNNKVERMNIFVKEFKIDAEIDIASYLTLIETKRSNIIDYTKKRICLTRLAVIESFILYKVLDYHFEYEYKTKSINDLQLNIVLTIKPNINISVSVPITCVQMLPKIEFLYFAEFMFKRDETYCNREDFGLEKYVDDNDNDQMFRIKNIKELDIILQKIDSWYGYDLD